MTAGHGSEELDDSIGADFESLHEGQRIGRFIVLRDLDGVMHAVSAGSVAAVCQTDDGALIMLPGGKMVRVEQSLRTVLGWLDCR